MNTNTNTTSTRTHRPSRLAAVWADIRNGQRRMDAVNRPWVNAPRRSS